MSLPIWLVNLGFPGEWKPALPLFRIVGVVIARPFVLTMGSGRAKNYLNTMILHIHWNTWNDKKALINSIERPYIYTG